MPLFLYVVRICLAHTLETTIIARTWDEAKHLLQERYPGVTCEQITLDTVTTVPCT
jgi:hypothetical protein